MSDLAYTRVTDIGILLELVAEAAGPDAVSRLLREQDLPATLFDNPYALMLYRDSLGLYSRGSHVAGERSIGLRAAMNVGICDFGPFGHYLHSAPDLEQALIRARDTIVFHESQSRVGFEHRGDGIVFSYRSSENGNVGWRHMADMCVCVMIDLVRSFVGEHWLPKYIEVDYRSGPWKNDLEDQFGIPVLVDRPATAIIFDRDLLQSPQIKRRPSPELITIADLKRQGRRIPRDFLSTTRNILRQRIRTGQTDLNGVAAKIGVGPRTFQRRLADEGVRYQNLLKDCMKERAVDLLTEPAMTITEVSDVLGYSSHSHFTRAFQRWSGTTPERFRKYRGLDNVAKW